MANILVLARGQSVYDMISMYYILYMILNNIKVTWSDKCDRDGVTIYYFY